MWCFLFYFLASPYLVTPQARHSRDTGKSPSSLGLADFDLLRVIGRGSYAKVLLVQLKKTERIYAMKVVKKELVNDDEVNNAEIWPAIRSKFFFLQMFKVGDCVHVWYC